MKLIRDLLVEGEVLKEKLDWVRDIPDVGGDRLFVVGFMKDKEVYMDTVIAKDGYTPAWKDGVKFEKNGASFPFVSACTDCAECKDCGTDAANIAQ